MGCVKNCPLAPWEKTLEWKLEDPKEQPIDVFRKVRDDIEVRVKELILEFK